MEIGDNSKRRRSSSATNPSSTIDSGLSGVASHLQQRSPANAPTRPKASKSPEASSSKTFQSHHLTPTNSAIAWHSSVEKWAVNVTLNGLKYYVGRYSDFDEARSVYDLVLMNKDELECKLAAIVEDDPRQKKGTACFKNFISRLLQPSGLKASSGKASVFRGVTAAKDKWCAKIRIGDQYYQIGTFEREEEASAHYECVLGILPSLERKLAKFNTPNEKRAAFKLKMSSMIRVP